MQDEERLVQRAKEHDQAALAQLYEENFDKIYRYVVVRIGDKMEAEDVTQQVFLKALRSISSFKWKGVPFSAWLFRLAHNQVVDYFRSKKKAAVPLDESLVSDDDSPQELTEHKFDIDRLLSATQRLTEAQREVISLRFAGGLSVAEVSGVMGRSQGAVKALQHSAILALRKRLTVIENE